MPKKFESADSLKSLLSTKIVEENVMA